MKVQTKIVLVVHNQDVPTCGMTRNPQIPMAVRTPFSPLSCLWPLSQVLDRCRDRDSSVTASGCFPFDWKGIIEWSPSYVSWKSHWSLFSIRSFIQVTTDFLLAFCRKVMSSSYIRNFPKCMTFLKKVASIVLVWQSANMIAVDIHRHVVWSRDCSFKSITSIVVRHSWQFGIAVFVIRSCKDLQSVIIGPTCSCFKDVSG